MAGTIGMVDSVEILHATDERSAGVLREAMIEWVTEEGMANLPEAVLDTVL